MVAEGIELPEQIVSLRDLGCELGQGFLFAKPMPYEALSEYLVADDDSVRSAACNIVTRGSTAPAGLPDQPVRPAAGRDFRLLWSGMTISLFGDGIFLIAMAWQAYELWNAPAALSILGIGMTIPTIAFLLPAGVLSDRFERRSLVLWSDVGRAVVVGGLAALALTGALEFWHLVVLVALCGIGTAFFTPAFEALVPDIVPKHKLAAANALDQFVRPIAFRLVGPALGGVLVASSGTGVTFAIDAGTFVASAVCVAFMRPPAHARSEHVGSSVAAVREGLRSSAAASGSGARSRPRPSPTSCSWVRRCPPSVRGEERGRRLGAGPGARLRCGRYRCGRRRGVHGAARPSTP